MLDEHFEGVGRYGEAGRDIQFQLVLHFREVQIFTAYLVRHVPAYIIVRYDSLTENDGRVFYGRIYPGVDAVESFLKA